MCEHPCHFVFVAKPDKNVWGESGALWTVRTSVPPASQQNRIAL